MDLGIFSWTNYSFSTKAAAQSAFLNDVVNFLTNPSYAQTQNTFFNTSGNAIYRSSNCFNGWTVHDSAAGTNQKVLKAPYPTAMGAGKFVYVKIGVDGNASGDNTNRNPFSLVLDVFESWNATTHVGTNGAGIGQQWSVHYGINIYPQDAGYQTFMLAASLYVIMANVKGVIYAAHWWGHGVYYNTSTGHVSINSYAFTPLLAGIMPYAESSGWHTSASSYPAIFATWSQGLAHPFGKIGISRHKQVNGTSAGSTHATDGALDASVRSTGNAPVGVPTTSIPTSGGVAGNMLAPIVPVFPPLGLRFQNANFSFSESMCDGLFMACSGTGAAFDTILSAAGKSHILFPVGSSSGGNNCLMFAIRIN
jgi:hypothetical protein